MPLKSWAEAVAGRQAEPQAQRLARLHGVLRRTDWLGKVDKWALANELLALADELSAARLGGDIGSRIRALHADTLDRETALIEAVWQALNNSGNDPQARYATALDHLVGQLDAAPQPLYGYALGRLTALERQFLERCAGHAPVTLFELATDAAQPVAHTLHQAWQRTDPPLRERAAELASAYPDSPLHTRLSLCPAPHLEAEARAVATWVAAQLNSGKRALALIALDRETARRVRALLERMEVLVADETGWTLSTTAAAAVIDRWLECVASDFPHVELLDLLKSPFLLGELAARQDAVLQLELALRRQGVAQGMADIQRLAFTRFGGALPDWLATLFKAKQGFAQTRAPLAVWLNRLLDSLGQLDATLAADAAGKEVLDTLDTLRRDLAADSEKYSFGEWRRWLNLALESATFTDTRVASPVVLTSLPDARGRIFEAVALIGADARHLPAAPAPGLFSQTTRAQLGLPTAADDATAATDDLIQLLTQGAALISWQAWHNDEPNPASPLVLRLQALHQAAWGTALPQQIGGQPPAQSSPLPEACVQPAPSVGAAQLPRRYSPTAYQTLLDCPYRFFVKNVLRIEELDAADEALDKSDYGTALHRILKAFHDSAPPPERDAALARLGEAAPPPNSPPCPPGPPPPGAPVGQHPARLHRRLAGLGGPGLALRVRRNRLFRRPQRPRPRRHHPARPHRPRRRAGRRARRHRLQNRRRQRAQKETQGSRRSRAAAVLRLARRRRSGLPADQRNPGRAARTGWRNRCRRHQPPLAGTARSHRSGRSAPRIRRRSRLWLLRSARAVPQGDVACLSP